MSSWFNAAKGLYDRQNAGNRTETKKKFIVTDYKNYTIAMLINEAHGISMHAVINRYISLRVCVDIIYPEAVRAIIAQNVIK